MEKICDFIKNNNSLEYDITYYIKHMNEEYIIYNYNDNIEIIDYIYDNIHNYFNEFNYDIIMNYDKPSILFIYNNRKYEIIYITDYWIVNIMNI